MAEQMNMVRLSKDWPVLVQLAEKHQLKSTQLHALQQFVDDYVEAPEDKKAQIFSELLRYLEEKEQAEGDGKIIFPVSGNGEL